MATYRSFFDPSIFHVTFGPRPTLSRKPRQNRPKNGEKIMSKTREGYVYDWPILDV